MNHAVQNRKPIIVHRVEPAGCRCRFWIREEGEKFVVCYGHLRISHRNSLARAHRYIRLLAHLAVKRFPFLAARGKS